MIRFLMIVHEWPEIVNVMKNIFGYEYFKLVRQKPRANLWKNWGFRIRERYSVTVRRVMFIKWSEQTVCTNQYFGFSLEIFWHSTSVNSDTMRVLRNFLLMAIKASPPRVFYIEDCFRYGIDIFNKIGFLSDVPKGIFHFQQGN